MLLANNLAKSNRINKLTHNIKLYYLSILINTLILQKLHIIIFYSLVLSYLSIIILILLSILNILNILSFILMILTIYLYSFFPNLLHSYQYFYTYFPYPKHFYNDNCKNLAALLNAESILFSYFLISFSILLIFLLILFSIIFSYHNFRIYPQYYILFTLSFFTFFSYRLFFQQSLQSS